MTHNLLNSKKIRHKKFKKIERLILKLNINFIDTAISYAERDKLFEKAN